MNVNKFIRTSLEKYSENEFIHDNHIRPMNQFILENTKIFKLEDGMSKIINYICDFFSYQKPEISTPPKNVSEYDDFIIKKSTIDLVNDFYSEDFTFFDYKKVEISKKNISFSELKSKIEATYD
ncbi:hypothetical protein BCT49_24445 [Vibrio lentus]|uniref:Uncharacterized protein n=2 Tax=Vibrio lentus TaxID=136468 RepID=A0A2N7KEF4_9VIBR|nr:hypothetical protein BCT49_24445 [Vibrio lentus]